MFSPVSPPALLRWYYKDFIWKLPANDREIFLTFDDGPIPGVTEYVLDELKNFNFKATFFCIGKNVLNNPKISERIVAEGHAIGNHTFNHYNGWKCSADKFLSDVDAAAEVIQSDLFRPPYGRIKKDQSSVLIKKYKIVMWDVLSYDFDRATSPEQCYKNVVNHVRPGSIIVFHDSVKAFKNLEYALPKCLEFFRNEKYKLLKL